MFAKEISHNIDHSEIHHDNSMEIDCEGSVGNFNLSASLSNNENEIYIEVVERSFDNDYYYFKYDNEEFGSYIYWRVF